MTQRKSVLVAMMLLWNSEALLRSQDAKPPGAVLENRALAMTAEPGRPGVTVSLKADAAHPRLELALQPLDAPQGVPITHALLIQNAAGKSVLHVTAGNAEADFSLGSAGYVMIQPGKNAAAVLVRPSGGAAAPGARYVVLPDFFADDVVFDPVNLALPKLTVPAENFLLQFIEGGNTIIMCVWPGNLSLPGAQGANAEPAKAGPVKEGPDPQVDLLFTGEGKGRRVAASRIEFQNKPVYVGILEQKGLWQDEDARALPAYTPTPIAWKRPFEARWRGDFILAPGKSMEDWPTRDQSFEFQSTRTARADQWWTGGTDAMDARFAAAASNSNPKKWWERGDENNPSIWQESLADFFIYPAVLKGDEVRLCLYADRSARHDAEKATQRARKADKNAPDVLPPNVYDRVLIYPVARLPATPVSLYTPVDLMRETLGAGPCEYVLDLAGVKPRPAGGDRPILSYATCGLWNDHISPILKGLKKKPDGTFQAVDEKTQAHLIQALEEMWYFVHAVHDRLREYKKWGAEAAQWCAQEGRKNAAVKPIADLLGAKLGRLNQDLGQHKFEGPGSEAYWKDRVPEIIQMVKEGQYPEIGSISQIRDLGNIQDERVSRCRQYVKGILQEILLQDGSNPELRAFAAELRDRSHRILRSMHPKEGF